MKLNLKLLLTLLLLGGGLYLLLAYRDIPILTPQQRADYRTKRYIGIAFIVGGGIICVGMYFTKTYKGTMSSDQRTSCDTCNDYKGRTENINWPLDYLKMYKKTCTECAEGYITDNKKTPSTDYHSKAVEYLKAAEAAQQRIREFDAAGEPFPTVPKTIPS
jgi:hypothetical protein